MILPQLNLSNRLAVSRGGFAVLPPPAVWGIAATFKCSKSSDVSVLSPVCFAEGGNEDRLPL